MDWLWALPVCALLGLVVVLLVAESGSPIGLVLPGSSLVLGLGVLAGTGLLPIPVAAMTVTAATVAGSALAHRSASRGGSGVLLPTGTGLARLLPAHVRRLVDRSASPWADAVARRPVGTAALAHLVTGSRTIAPRIAARTGVPLSTMLRGTVPAALLWAWGLVAAGALAGTTTPLVDSTVAVAGTAVVVVLTWVLLRRRTRARAAAPAARRPVRRTLGSRRWLVTIAASSADVGTGAGGRPSPAWASVT
jgi:membrane protein DedA with SNARE-associated domain